MRANFKKSDIKRLAEKAGNYSCFPGCGAVTVGPSDEALSATSSTGVACHIIAASTGKNARRADSVVPVDEKADIANAVWMCAKHAKLIDTDEDRFTISMLRNWRKIGEKAAQIMHEQNLPHNTAYKLANSGKLLSQKIILPPIFNVNSQIGNALQDSYASIVWEDFADYIRDFLIEYVRNSHQHGGAKQITLDIISDCIKVTDDGKNFNPRKLSLNNNSTGGVLAYKKLEDRCKHKLFFTHSFSNGMNTLCISIPRDVGGIESLTNCTLKMDFFSYHNKQHTVNISETCEEIFIILPDFYAISDVSCLTRYQQKICHDIETSDRLTIFVYRANSISTTVRELILNQFPAGQLLEMES